MIRVSKNSLRARRKRRTNNARKDDGSVITGFDLIEMGEGRWYPKMWRNSWK
jgi:hypothetical protein